MSKGRNKELREFLKAKLEQIEKRDPKEPEPEEQRFNNKGIDVSF